MADIVERLRRAASYSIGSDLCTTAADTITALRGEVERMTANQINGDEGDELVALRAENTRLREALEKIACRLPGCANGCQRHPLHRDGACEARAALAAQKEGE